MSYTNSSWLSEMQGASAVIDQTFGELVTVTPADRRPNYQAEPQPEHAVELQAVFSWRSKTIFKPNKGTSLGNGDAFIESREPIFGFSRDALPWALRAGDIIARHCDGTEFEITTVAPDGVSRVTVNCVQLGRQSQ